MTCRPPLKLGVSYNTFLDRKCFTFIGTVLSANFYAQHFLAEVSKVYILLLYKSQFHTSLR